MEHLQKFLGLQEFDAMLGSRILVVDDDERVKKSLELVMPEYKWLHAPTGEAALELLRKPHDVDLVILDYKIDPSNGIEILKEIKKIDEGIGVMMLTAYGSKEIVVQALEHRADDFADKPYEVDEIRQKIRKFLDERDRRQVAADSVTPIDRIILLLERNSEKFLTLQDAAELVQLSPKYISRVFKKETRMNFAKFRSDLKVQHAKKLLRDRSLNIHEIADRLGYQNSTSFMKMFKRVAGCTPTEYRRKILR